MESTSTSSSTTSTASSVITNRSAAVPGKLRIENPFTFKVGQVFTGVGVGCGVGIGVGRPLNLGAIPMLGQVMSAARGATDALSGVTRHVNDTLKKVGAKNIQAGIGCGVGIGHGFGVGLAVKPSVLHQVQSSAMQTMTNLMTKIGLSPDTFNQSNVPMSLHNGINMSNNVPSNQNSMGNIMALPQHAFQGQPRDGNLVAGSSYESFASKGTSLDTPFGSRTEQVISNFMQSPVLNEEKVEVNEMIGRLQSENNMLQMVLKHQQIIEELMEENSRLRNILVEDLKIPPNKVHGENSSKHKTTCSDCFECRRKQRRK